jgi:nucleoid-associated protein YgaU
MAIAAPFPAARATRTPSRPMRPRAAAPTRPAAGRPAATRPAGGLQLTRRGRITLGVLSTLALLVVVLFSGRLTADAGTSMSDQGRATGVVVVQAGESLWQIAQAVAPQADPRETVTLIRELNGLGDAAVMPGQSIVVPVVGASGA